MGVCGVSLCSLDQQRRRIQLRVLRHLIPDPRSNVQPRRSYPQGQAREVHRGQPPFCRQKGGRPLPPVPDDHEKNIKASEQVPSKDGARGLLHEIRLRPGD